MQLTKLDESAINKRLSYPLKTKDGRKLVNGNTILSERLIKRLKSSGFNAVYIQDENTDIELKETLPENKRAEIAAKLQEVYDNIANNQYNDIEFARFIRNNILPEIKNEPISIPINETMDKNDILHHSLNVCLLSVRTALTMGLTQDKVEAVARAALLHEIGKILKKKSRNNALKKKSYEEVGYSFLKNKHSSVLVYTTVRYHNETLDEKGPFHLSKDNQHELTKIISLCNYYENLLREAKLLPHECFEKVQALVNFKFDPDVFKAFRKSLYIYPVGLPVKLSNGNEGIVAMQNKAYPLRPIIKADGIFYNLLENLSLFIEKVTI
ncbi:HD-GYP domain-containing protein [Thermohalobacter berrensis]|uniref:HD/PDEase domain-containing protein n=1 Tax=Thermohalobacter berrensis TaxID=99594 RepID=A0A419SWD6_9FIRM|nr:HD domain-containing protein [Thermohalobacter berrensis]RKD29544.1 hypothetical protein BET03_05660 [Thermohalobacter berrensis]